MRPVVVIAAVYGLMVVHTAIYQVFRRRNQSWTDRPRYQLSRATRAIPWLLSAVYVAVLVDVPLALLALHLPPPGSARFLAGVALAVAALGLLVWSLRALGENYSDCHDGRVPLKRVKHGPYRFFGHPIYVANVTLMAGVTAMVLDAVMVASTVVVAALYLVSARDEERALPK